MKIYVAHSKKLEFQRGLYDPLRKSSLNDVHEIVLPHETSDRPYNSKEFLQTCDVMLAEVTYPATGLGIELGWADALGVPIIAMHQRGSKLSSSVKVLTSNFFEYSNEQELISELEKRLESLG